MKKITSIVVMALMALSLCMLSSCDSKLAKLKSQIEESNKDLPMDMGAGMTFRSIELDESAKEVVAKFDMGDMPIDPAAMNKNQELMKNSLVCTMNLEESFAKVVKACADADVSFTLVFLSDPENVKVTMTPEDVKSAATMSEEEACEKYLDAQIKLTKAQMPMRVDEATMLEDFSRENGYIVYTYTVLESIVSISALEENKADFRENIKSQFGTSAMAGLINTCKKAKIGIIYRYVGNESGQKIEFVFESDEL